MEIVCSKTGSDGNFSMINDGKTYLGIDCGISYGKASKLSNYQLSKLSGLIVTHFHSDHSASISDFLKKGIKVYANEEVWSICPDLGAYNKYKNTIDTNTPYFEVGTFKIKPFEVPHTNANGEPCLNYGFLIYSTITKEKMLWITDCAYIKYKFPACDYICIECNYIDIEDISKELEYINKVVETRRVVSHLSLNRCVDFISKQDLSKVKLVKLLHLTKSQGIIEGDIKERFAKEFPDLEVRI